MNKFPVSPTIDRSSYEITQILSNAMISATITPKEE
jgi:hypothetical protein